MPEVDASIRPEVVNPGLPDISNQLADQLIVNDPPKIEDSPNRKLIRKWLNKSMKVKITDGRTIIGIFLCTDKHSNLILGSCHEYSDEPENGKEPRTIGLSMIPGQHIVSIDVDERTQT